MSEPRDDRLGILLLEAGAITSAELEEAESHQRKHGGKFGEVLISLGIVGPEVVERFLVAQDGNRARRPTIRFERALELFDMTDEALRKMGGE